MLTDAAERAKMRAMRRSDEVLGKRENDCNFLHDSNLPKATATTNLPSEYVTQSSDPSASQQRWIKDSSAGNQNNRG
jgi:hypothetical protein